MDIVICKDLINSWTDISEAERDAFLTEMPYPDIQLCPNTTSLLVTGDIFWETYFSLRIIATQEAYDLGIIERSEFFKGVLTRYFNAEKF